MKKPLVFLISILILMSSCSPVPPTEPIKYIDTGIDSEKWAYIGAGDFLKGQFDENTELNYDFEIMITDVTNAQFVRFLNEALAENMISIKNNLVTGYYKGDKFTGYKHENEISAGDWLYIQMDEPGLRIKENNGIFEVIAGYENHPVVFVSWFATNGYAAFYNYRLPTENEWEKAARGTDDNRPFPWGSGISGENANYYNSHDLLEKEMSGNGNTTPVGFYNGRSYSGFDTVKSVSPYGLYDMAGNVWQWMSEIREKTHLRYMRGGSKTDHSHNLRIWTSNSAGPDYTSPSIGFRCVRKPQED